MGQIGTDARPWTHAMRIPHHVQVAMINRCTNRVVCDRFTGTDLSIVMGLLSTAHEEARPVPIGWHVIFDQPNLPQTFNAGLVGTPNQFCFRPRRNVHSILVEWQADIRTTANNTLNWTMDLVGGSVPDGPPFSVSPPVSLAQLTKPGVRCSYVSRILIHLMGHWKDTAVKGGPAFQSSGAASAILEDGTGSTRVSVPFQADTNYNQPNDGDLAVVRDMTAGLYAPMCARQYVNVFLNTPTFTLERLRVYGI